ncbi:MAG: hypothetical protein HS126_25510 [Anaerolineales bacterium]|nr:hypothetical protein [Anaerolineales bacterium]
MKSRALYQTLFIAVGLLVMTLLSLAQIQQISRAQGSVTLNKILNRTSPVVRVGEVLSFTITLTNDAGFTLTNVTLVDTYNQGVLAFAGGAPAPDGIDSGNGVLTWTNVAAPPILPGQTLTFTVFFTAEHPRTTVVNRVRAQDITGTMGAISDTNDTDATHDAIGGQAPLFKNIFPPGSQPQVGFPVTFTHLITNDGAALMTHLPLTDTYNATILQFNFAIPSPTLASPGVLVWADLTTDFGDIPPFGTVVVTTVFTAAAQFNGSVNQASTAGALDEFNNALAAGFDEVPITIIGGGQDTDDRVDEDNDNDDNDNEEDIPAPTATVPVVSTATPAPTPTLEQFITNTTSVTGTTPVTNSSTPRYLPETGQWGLSGWPIIAWGLGLLMVSLYLWKKN